MGKKTKTSNEEKKTEETPEVKLSHLEEHAHEKGLTLNQESEIRAPEEQKVIVTKI